MRTEDPLEGFTTRSIRWAPVTGIRVGILPEKPETGGLPGTSCRPTPVAQGAHDPAVDRHVDRVDTSLTACPAAAVEMVLVGGQLLDLDLRTPAA
jgi:hypothetical protein